MSDTPVMIRNAVLIDGTGAPPRRDAAIVVDGPRIRDVGPESRLDVTSGDVIDAQGRTVMPGLIDVHVHPSLSGRVVPGVLKSTVQPLALTVIETERNLRRLLAAGYTTVRDCGAIDRIDVALRQAIDTRLFPGPRLICCGRALTITGGHADTYFYAPPNHVPTPHSWGVVCDGVDEVRRAARDEIRAGVDWIKITHAGNGSWEVQPGKVQFTIEEVAAACDVAHKAGVKVCCHAQGLEAIRESVLAGVDEVEHGYELNAEVAEMMTDRGVALAIGPLGGSYRTRHMTYEDKLKAGSPAIMARKSMAFPYTLKQRAVQVAKRAGVKLLVNSDAFGEANGVHNAQELFCLVDSGLSPMDALLAATRDPADVLGLDAGTIEPGKLADLIVVDGDPLQDITVLQDVNRIKLVMKGGRIEHVR
jgi:imidazolonepropionase-like amidohydrolase